MHLRLASTFLIFAISRGLGQECNGLDTKAFNRMRGRAFSNLTNAQSTNVGSSAAIDIKDGLLSLAATTVFANASLLAIKVSGGAPDGLLAIFANSHVNKKIGLDAQYSFLTDSSHISYSANNCTRYSQEVARLKTDSALRTADVEGNFALTLALLDSQRLASVEATLSRRVQTADGWIRDSLNVGIRRTRLSIEALGARLRALRAPAGAMFSPAQVAEKEAIKRAVRDGEAKLIDSIPIEGFRLGWFSVGFAISNEENTFIRPESTYVNQVIKRAHVSYDARVQYSYYSFAPIGFRSYFIALGVALGVGDNHDKLERVDVSEATIVGTGPSERVTTKKYNALKGAYEDGLRSITVTGEAYYWLFEHNPIAIHFLPRVAMKDKLNAQADATVGVVGTVRKADKVTAVVNAELYWTVADLWRRNRPADLAAKYGVGERTTVGMRFSVPFNFTPGK